MRRQDGSFSAHNRDTSLTHLSEITSQKALRINHQTRENRERALIPCPLCHIKDTHTERKRGFLKPLSSRAIHSSKMSMTHE